MSNEKIDFGNLSLEEKKAIYKAIVARSLVRYRKAINCSQTDMAVMLAVQSNTLSQYEHGHRGFPSELIPIFCEFVRVPIADFFDNYEKAHDLTQEELEQLIEPDRRLKLEREPLSKEEILNFLFKRYIRLQGELERNSVRLRMGYNICGTLFAMIDEETSEREFKELKGQMEYHLEILERLAGVQ